MRKRALLRRVRRHELALEDDQPPDFTGWSAQQVLLWAARNGGYEAIVAEANEGGPPNMVTPEQGEAELRAAGKWPVSEAAPPPEAEAAAEPAPAPGEPPPEPQWWEEKARWRHRGPEDYDWEDDKARGYFCEFEYDPLEDA